MPGAATVVSMSTVNYYDYIIEIAQNAGVWQLRATIKDNTGAVLTQSSWVNTSSLKVWAHYYIVMGRAITGETLDGSMRILQFQAS